MYCGKKNAKESYYATRNDYAHLLQFAKEGKIVVRLKGGDPSIFGRVGEEAENFSSSNIPYEIVPGHYI